MYSLTRNQNNLHRKENTPFDTLCPFYETISITAESYWQSTYCSFLVYISSIGQEVHHTVIVALPGCPDQRSGAILQIKNDRVQEMIQLTT